MRDRVSPKQVAQAIGVSESSLKRWCDQGRIRTIRTAGGHRRLPVAAVVEFLRETGRRLVRPDLLGLPTNTGSGPLVMDRAADQLRRALLEGDEEVARQVLLDLYLARRRIADISDQVLSPALGVVGEKWSCGEAEVYEERRACEIAERVLHELRALVPAPPADALAAIGGTPEGDFYTLPTTAVELVLREHGWRATNLGSSLPRDTLLAAIEDARPRLFWLSVSHARDEDELAGTSAALFEKCVSVGAAMVVGGSALAGPVRSRMQYSAHCDGLRRLESFVATLVPSPGAR